MTTYTDSELLKEGERLHQQFLTDEANASPEQRAEALRITEQHLMEYGYSYAAILHEIVSG